MLSQLSYHGTTVCTVGLVFSSVNLKSLFPALHNVFSPILAAIFAGNACVVKCSESVVWSTQWYVAAIKECLRVCGQDPELIQVRAIHHLSNTRKTELTGTHTTP